MAGYSKGIVDTRKLNKDSKAKLGRRGDTEIREVDNKASHVNALEAYLIDVNGKVGEDYTKRVGAGTVNPLTGMPEYYTPEKLDYDELQALGGSDLTEYYAGWGLGQSAVDAIGDFGGQEELGFLSRQKELSMGRAEDVRSLTETGLGATKGFAEQTLGLQRQFAEQGLGQAQQFAMQGAGSQYQTQTAGLASGLASGQRAAGRGLAQARAGAQSAAGRSGLARGSAQASFESQKSDLMGQSRDMSKQYQVGRAQATAGLGMAQRQSAARYGLGMQQTAATEALGIAKAGSAYDIGMATSAADYGYATGQAGLAYDQGVFGIKQAEEEKFYDYMAEHGGEARGYEQTDASGNVIKKINDAGQKLLPTGPNGTWVVVTDVEYDAVGS